MSEKETARKVVRTVVDLKLRFTEEELEALLTKINREETVKPLIDPTYYIKNSDNLEKLKEQVEALQKVIAT